MVSLMQLDKKCEENTKKIENQIELDKKSKEERKQLLRKQLLRKMLNEQLELERYLKAQREKNK